MADPAAHGAIADAAPAVHEDGEDVTPRSDFWQGIGWVALGIAVLAGSITMDRLESQNINPYTVPGLLPGLLGIAMMLLGSVLAIRSWQRGALAESRVPFTDLQRATRKRVWTVILLVSIYSVVLVGHGLPFWLASAIFVTGSILILQRMSADPSARQITPRLVAKAVVIGVIAALVTHVVFQDVFLVRLP